MAIIISIVYIVYIIYLYSKYTNNNYINKYINNANKYPIIETLLNIEGDKVAVISKFPLNWLKNKVKSWNIPHGQLIEINSDESKKNLNITNNESYKRIMAIAILRKLPEIHKENILLVSTYSTSKLNKYAQNLGIVVTGRTREDIMADINVAINPESTIKRWNNSYSHLLSEGEEEEDIIDNTPHKTGGILRACPPIKKTCITDTVVNDYKYTECLDQDSYEKCMVCFNNKIGDSRYIGKGTNFNNSDKVNDGCDYLDMEILCMKKNPDSCKKSKYLRCPCRTNQSERETADDNIDKNNSLIDSILTNKTKNILDSSVKFSSEYIPESTLNISQDEMTKYYNKIFKKQ